MRLATYRVQLRPEFSFSDAADITGYIKELGISELYCSPILQAAPGSTHGYDVVDHSRLSVDLGGEPGFDRLAGALDEHGLGLTVDIVPNHMAIGDRANRWWWDVLENGPSSVYATYFDIDWPGDGARHEQTVLVPVLGDRYGRILEAGDLRLWREGGAFEVRYFDHAYPVSPRTFDTILGRAAVASGSEELRGLADEFGELPHAGLADPVAGRLRHDEKERLRERLQALLNTDSSLAAAVDGAVDEINSDPEELDRLLCRQNYRLSYWRAAREELDYRRFFNIETLIGLRVEDDQVFADTHETLARLIRSEKVSGLRVDHVDGLSDPDGYLQRLHRLAPDTYVVVEKILDRGEHMPEEWPVQGTTGYDFITRVNNAYVDPAGEAAMTSCYTDCTGEPSSYSEVVTAAKYQIMTEELSPEVERLGRLLHGICDNHRSQRDRTRTEVRAALEAVLASFPVYRTYVQADRPLRPSDEEHVRRAVDAANELAAGGGLAAAADSDLIGFIGDLLLLRVPGGAEAEFARMFPQVSAPVMAKGAEDTAFYRYNRLISLNEVGGDPGTFGLPLEDFHAGCREAAERIPHTMLTLNTHDTKRSADVRARISLLAQIPDAWRQAVERWLDMTDRHGREAGPDRNARYLLLQTLVGAWPIATDRLTAYMDKAAKEAKAHTTWSDPDDDYDAALRQYVERSTSDTAFISDLQRFLSEQRIVEIGRATSLAQWALMMTTPGVPDVYQGTETFEHSLVDPDNRRPVDYAGLRQALDGCRTAGPDAIASGPPGDDAKIWLTRTLLAHRGAHPELYLEGGYEPLEVTGSAAEHLIGFVRQHSGRVVAVLAGRHLARFTNWGDTSVRLPSGQWRPVVGTGASGGGPTRVAEVAGSGPVAVLERV